jgi:putative Mn2+ efflux pump MntP
MQALALIVNLAALVICISVAIAVDNSSIAAVALGVLSVLAACGCALGVARLSDLACHAWERLTGQSAS